MTEPAKSSDLKAVEGPGPNEARINPFRLKPNFAARIWGREALDPWYSETGLAEKVGEAWLTGPACVVETGPHTGETLGHLSKQFPGQLGNGDFPLLVKMLFPEENLSVQVHPDDAAAQASGHPRGKTECWYVLDAREGSKVACGLKHGVDLDQMRTAIGDGTIEELLEWLPVVAGEMIFVDAGTVHAIGGGMVILEVQQTCDITYRLFDFGRARDLHLDQGLAAVKFSTRAGKVKPEQMEGFVRLIETEYFVVDRFEIAANDTLQMPMDGTGCVACLRGEAAVNEVRFSAGHAVIVPEGSTTVSSTTGATVLRCWEPGKY